ncbi:MAG: flagellar basal body P-ring formation protein FlgA [Spirochaetales bacterium]|nr:flagellar basal body P-ring formation protein FlgA [Spirochaetales bacterium]
MKGFLPQFYHFKNALLVLLLLGLTLQGQALVFYLKKEVKALEPIARLEDFLISREPLSPKVKNILKAPVRLPSDELHILPFRYFYDELRNIGETVMIVGTSARFFHGSENSGQDKLKSGILELVQNENSSRGNRLSLELAFGTTELEGFLSDLKLGFYQKQSYGNLLLGRNLVQASYISIDNLPKTDIITLFIKQYQQGAYTTQYLTKDSEVSPSVIEFREIEIKPGQKSCVTPEDNLAAMTALRSLSKGQLVLKSDLTKKLLVLNGQDVFIYFRANSMELRSPGRAFASGARGDSVRVKPQDSDQYFDARVIGHEEVLIEL